MRYGRAMKRATFTNRHRLACFVACALAAGACGSSPDCTKIDNNFECPTVPGCHLTEYEQVPCTPPPGGDGCGGYSTCTPSASPNAGAGASCQTLDETACGRRDDCATVRRLDTGAFMMCTVPPLG
jgi:hypothetical protein